MVSKVLTSPLEQFEIVPLIPLRVGTIDISFTNSSLRRLVTVAVLTLFGRLLVASSSKEGSVVGGGRLVPSRWQSVGEGLYLRAQSRLTSRGPKGQPFFPLIFTLFSFLLVANLLGLVPYSFTVTSHIIVTFTLAAAIWIGKLILGLRIHGVRLFGRFLPGGAPIARAPRLIPLEVRGFVITVISLSVRLFANRRAGHILLKVRAGFAWTRRRAGGLLWVAHFLPLLVLYRLLFLETGVARVQAYVFALLTARFINDVVEGGH